MTRYTRAHILMISATFTFVSLMGLCNAAEPDLRDTLRMDVSYSDLNLDSAAGVKVLYSRLRSAARHVCVPFDDGQQRAINFHFHACFKNALDSAVAKINKPTLTAMHARERTTVGG